MIHYTDILAYLTAIKNLAKKSIDFSPHGAFWEGMDYLTFTTGFVPGVGVPIMDTANPLQSPIFVILVGPSVFSGLPVPQMPKGGPFITDPGYMATLADGTTITGQQIIDNMKAWLSNGFPE